MNTSLNLFSNAEPNLFIFPFNPIWCYKALGTNDFEGTLFNPGNIE